MTNLDTTAINNILFNFDPLLVKHTVLFSVDPLIIATYSFTLSGSLANAQKTYSTLTY
jgi:hypothetical protein